MYEANDVAMQKVANRSIPVYNRLLPAWNDCPFVIVVLVMVARDLLLIGSNGIRLDVRVQKATSPTHVLQRQFRAKRNLYTAMRTNMVNRTDRLTERILGKVVANKIGLE